MPISNRHAPLLLSLALVSIALGCGRAEPPPPAEPEAVETVVVETAIIDEEYLNSCPVCGQQSVFEPYGIASYQRSRAQCANCGSLERHRLMFLYFESKPELFSEGMTLLHFAPNRSIRKLFRRREDLEYVTADLFKKADLKLDITAIELEDDSIDAVICYHVLEHVDEDRKGMAELYRILKPGGWALLEVPLYGDRPDTLQDPEIDTPRERIDHYGIRSHVRLYGWRDFADRLEEAGFEVAVERFVDGFDQEQIRKLALDPAELMYFCSKPLDSGA
jgi:SAM-dependent methyltransferase